MSKPMVRNAFTLVEILIVVVILGILAALVVPNFTRATEDSTKSALLRQLQSINHQIEIYRARHTGGFPTNDLTSPLVEGGTNYGWGAMVGKDYFREAPMNPYTGSRAIVAGTLADAIAHSGNDSSAGWYYLVEPNSFQVFAAGLDPATGLLSNEAAP